MIVSIIIDFTRSRVLMKTAKKHNSQALEQMLYISRLMSGRLPWLSLDW